MSRPVVIRAGVARTGRTVAVIIASILCLGCPGKEKLPVVTVMIGNSSFTLEVARTPEEQRVGLMHRKKMDLDHGMLFVFSEDRRLSFWMKDTLIPLSIAYIDSTGVIRELHDMEPGSLRPIESDVSVRYAIELNRGAFSAAGARIGDRILLPPEALK